MACNTSEVAITLFVSELVSQGIHTSSHKNTCLHAPLHSLYEVLAGGYICVQVYLLTTKAALGLTKN